jgi:acetyl esterase/lipase
MASLQAHLFSSVLKWRLKPKLKTARNEARIRELLNPPPFAVPPEVRITPEDIGGVPGEWVETDRSRGTLLYIHGGGYIACSIKTHRPNTCALAQLGLRVFVPNYRLAPEHPFPAAIHDVVQVFLAMTGEDAHPVSLAGDSAGGGLALSLMLSLRDAARPLPKAAALFSPWTDLACTGASIQYNAKKCSMFEGEGLQRAASLYLAGTPATDPLASPVYAKLNKLPPLLIHVGANETLLDDSTRLAQNAFEDGVEVKLKVWPVVPHGWQLFYPRLPEARTSLQEAAEFLA